MVEREEGGEIGEKCNPGAYLIAGRGFEVDWYLMMLLILMSEDLREVTMVSLMRRKEVDFEIGIQVEFERVGGGRKLRRAAASLPCGTVLLLCFFLFSTKSAKEGTNSINAAESPLGGMQPRDLMSDVCCIEESCNTGANKKFAKRRRA